MCRIHVILGKENIPTVELDDGLFERISYNYLQLNIVLIPYYTFIMHLKGPKMSPRSNKPIGVIAEMDAYIVQYCSAIFQRDRFPSLDGLCLHSG